jgi:hypothetical protein
VCDIPIVNELILRISISAHVFMIDVVSIATPSYQFKNSIKNGRTEVLAKPSSKPTGLRVERGARPLCSKQPSPRMRGWWNVLYVDVNNIDRSNKKTIRMCCLRVYIPDNGMR